MRRKNAACICEIHKAVEKEAAEHFSFSRTLIEHRTYSREQQEKFIDPVMLFAFRWSYVQARWGRIGFSKLKTEFERRMGNASWKNCTFMDYAQKLRIARAGGCCR